MWAKWPCVLAAASTSPRRRAWSPIFIIVFVCSSRVAMAIAISSERRRHFHPQPKGVWVEVPCFFMALIGLLEDNDRIAKLCATFLHFAGHQVTIYDNSLNCLHALFSQRRSQENLDRKSTRLNSSHANISYAV